MHCNRGIISNYVVCLSEKQEAECLFFFIAFVVFTAFAPSDTPVPVLLLESYYSDALTAVC